MAADVVEATVEVVPIGTAQIHNRIAITAEPLGLAPAAVAVLDARLQVRVGIGRLQPTYFRFPRSDLDGPVEFAQREARCRAMSAFAARPARFAAD